MPPTLRTDLGTGLCNAATFETRTTRLYPSASVDSSSALLGLAYKEHMRLGVGSGLGLGSGLGPRLGLGLG